MAYGLTMHLTAGQLSINNSNNNVY